MTTTNPISPVGRLTDDEVHALAMAEQTGADGVYSGDWPTALRTAAATWQAEGQPGLSGLTPAGETALHALQHRLGLTVPEAA